MDFDDAGEHLRVSGWMEINKHTCCMNEQIDCANVIGWRHVARRPAPFKPGEA